MIKYVLKQNKNAKSKAYNKYYAHAVVEQTMDLAALARHMEEHNSGFSEAMCTGVMIAMVKCIKEQILDGKNVKIDDLAIFSCGIKNKGGAASAEEFSTTEHIEGVKLRARATGELRTSSLNLEATLRKASTVIAAGDKKDATTPSGEGGASEEGNKEAQP